MEAESVKGFLYPAGGVSVNSVLHLGQSTVCPIKFGTETLSFAEHDLQKMTYGIKRGPEKGIANRDAGWRPVYTAQVYDY